MSAAAAAAAVAAAATDHKCCSLSVTSQMLKHSITKNCVSNSEVGSDNSGQIPQHLRLVT